MRVVGRADFGRCARLTSLGARHFAFVKRESVENVEAARYCCVLPANAYPYAFGESCFSVPQSVLALFPPSQRPRVSPSNGNGVSVPVGLLCFSDIFIPCESLQRLDCCTALLPADCSHGRKLIAKFGQQL